jgi:hypothetical protein
LAVPGDFRGVSLRKRLRATLPIGRMVRPADDVAAIPMSLMAIRWISGRSGRCETGGRMIQDNEKLVRAFYEATAPEHRARLRALQSPHVVYGIPEGTMS